MTPSFATSDISIDFSLRLFGLLRTNGIQLGTLQTIACTQAIALLETVDHAELMRLYRVTLINRKQDLYHLQRIFALLLEAYLLPAADAENALHKLEDGSELTIKRRVYAGESTADDDNEELTKLEGYSTHEVDHHKDFRLLPKQQFHAVLAELEKLAKKYAAIARRKSKSAKRGRNIDLRSSARRSVKFDGDIIDWRFKRKAPTHARLVIVVDVSGSMEIYSTFLLNFLYFLNKHQRLKIEVFVFSTYLQRLTTYFRLKNFQDMLESVSLHFSGWSGGTKIGRAIEVLNDAFATVITPKTAVVIMSDGWDTGDAALLDREMARVSSRAKSIIWINPLKGDPSYQPLALGMATARPYCDEFISGHSIDSLKAFATLINT